MNLAHASSRYLALRRRSTKTGFISALKSRRNRSASDSVVHGKLLSNNEEKIEIIVELRNLADTLTSTSNNYVFSVLYENDYDDERIWLLHSTSEPKLRSSNHISFNMSFTVDYFFERVQLLKIEIRDFSIGAAFKNAVGNVIGSCVFELDELIGAFGTQIKLPLSTKTSVINRSSGRAQVIPQGSHCGWIHVSGRLPEKAAPVILQFSGKNLEKKDKFFDETSVFFTIHKIENDETKTELYRSEALREHSHPIWRPFNLHLKKIADNRNRLLEITVMYRDEMNKIGVIGSFLTTYAKMKYGPGAENIYNLVNHKKKSKKKYLKSGTMELVKFSDVSFYSFLDYITSGTQLHLAIAVDFSTNLNDRESNNTHAFDSDFHCAIKGIGGIIRDYSSCKMFPAFGVGAKIPHVPDNRQFFHLNFEAQPHCRGIDGLLDAYRNAKRKVIPIANDRTVYLSVVNTVAKMAENEGKHGLHYFVLLIFISNSSIDNSKKLFNAITNVTKAPISIIFLGRQVAELNEFYSITSNRKNASLCSGRIAMNSDFVEFIDLNSVMIQEATLRQNAKRIAERALRNVPWHLIAYMHKNNIAAKPPIQINRSSVFHSSHLIPNQPSQYVERLHWDRNEQNFIGFITPTASRKHVKSVERNANEEKFRKKTMFHSQSVMSRGDRDEELNSSTAHQLTPKYHSQRHPTRVLRRQLAIS